MSTPFIDTGLKAIDLFAPIPLGGDVLITGEPKSGARVLGNELIHRFARRPGNAPTTTVFLDSTIPDAAAFEEEVKETVAGAAEIFRVDAVTSEILGSLLVHRPFTLGNAAFAFSLDPAFIAGFLHAVKDGRQANLFTKLTALVVTEGMSPEGFDAHISTIRALASEAIFPAVDVRGSASNASGSTALPPITPASPRPRGRPSRESWPIFLPGGSRTMLGSTTPILPNDPPSRHSFSSANPSSVPNLTRAWPPPSCPSGQPWKISGPSSTAAMPTNPLCAFDF